MVIVTGSPLYISIDMTSTMFFTAKCGPAPALANSEEM